MVESNVKLLCPNLDRAARKKRRSQTSTPPSNKAATHANGFFMFLPEDSIDYANYGPDCRGKPSYQSNCLVQECGIDIKNGPDRPTVSHFHWRLCSVFGPWAHGPVSRCPLLVAKLQPRARAPKTEPDAIVSH